MDGFDGADATQDTSQQKRRFNGVRPVTIRQLSQTVIKEELIWNGEVNRYSLSGHDFRMATFVGNIIEVVHSGDNTRTFRIEDGTGKITSMYTIGNEGADDLPRAGTYARIFGVPRNFNEVVVFSIYFIRPVEDPHEVLFHLMEAMVVTLQLSRDLPPPRLNNSQFAMAIGPALPLSPVLPDPTISMRSLALYPPPLQSRPQPVASTSLVDDEPRGDTKGSVEQDFSGSASDVETAAVHDASEDDEGSTEYYTDQPPDSPLERSPSPTPVHPFAKNHSFEGHLGREEGSSAQSSQSTQKPNIRSSEEEGEDVRTRKGKYKSQRRGDAVPGSPTPDSDDELEGLLSELSPQILPFTPPRKLKPDPYAEWSPAKRKIMVLFGTKTLGEEVNVKRALGEGTPKLEMRNAIRELVREGEIETADGINYMLTDKGPKYPRF